jgi:exonuclease SbcC
MVPVQLKLYNFTSYGTAVPALDFTGFRLACLSGHNGAGKSSLLDAITWAVWGTSRAGDSADKLVRINEKEMWVEFIFELEGSLYRVARKRLLKGTGSTSLEFFIQKNAGIENFQPLQNWLNLTEGTIRATQEKIIKTLHMTYEVFVNSSYLRQGNADEFTLKGATERKKILSDILGLNHYDLFEEKAKEKAKDLTNKIASIDYQVLEIESELSFKDSRQLELTQAEIKVREAEIQRTALETEIKSLREQKETFLMKNQMRQKILEGLEKSRADQEEIVRQGQQRAERIKKIKERLDNREEIEKNLSELGKLEEENKILSEKQSELLNLTTQKSNLVSRVATVKKQIETLNTEIQKIQGEIKKVDADFSKCPLCGSELNKDHKAEVLGKLKKDLQEKEVKLKDLGAEMETKELEEIESKIAKLGYHPARHQHIRQEIIRLEPARKMKEEISSFGGQLEAEEKAYQELRIIFQKKKGQIETEEENLKNFQDFSEDLRQVAASLQAKEALIESLKSQENEARAILGKAKQLVERSTQLETLREQKLREKSKLAEERNNYEDLALAFGKKGVQAMIIETAIPEIEEEANKLLDKLSEGRMKVTFETQREAKGGGTIETLDIIISDEMGSRSYEMYSGGESFRVNFAIRLALSKLLTHRAGAKLQFLIIDEGFGTQDVQGRDRIVETINLIKEGFEKILIITHVEELKDVFPCRVEVTKGNQGSTFELVA